ncbi:MAG TPA: hypothetical protein IGS37_06260 [Synechococcales cyanobacterium M55_K2018_004]|nr:hypothetical protein [Synechococcales cyanobacterium M55_K2018_004]
MSAKTLDETLSTAIAERIKSKARAPFDNAYKAALATQEAIYVQGFLVVASRPNKPLEHAWVEVGDRIIDPNLPHLKKNPQDLHYFAAQQLTVKQLKAIIEESQEDYPDDDPLPVYGKMPYEYYGDVMLGGREYQAAFEAAAQLCRQLHQQLADRN